jgi:serine/threonine protein kinase
MKTDPSNSSSSSLGDGGKPAAAPAWLGKRIGQFKLLELLGKGAMGKVFRAEDVRLQRHVALKCLSRKSGNDNGKTTYTFEQFVREARSEATLEHPHVVQVYEIDEHNGILYIAMELVEGGNLQALVKASGPMDCVRACQLTAEAAEALAYAHKLGVIHRDVKPANLMLTRSGRCKLTDFGLARMDDPSDAFHLPSEAVGTPQFMAPELARGKPATPQSDIYSLGATLWFLLTGKPPFIAPTTAELIRMHLNDPLPDLHALRPDVPESLIKAIHTAMAKDPAKRYSDAEQFAKVLRVYTIPVGSSGALSSTGVLSDFGSQQQIQEQQIRRMGWRTVGVGALVAACIAGAISAVFWNRDQKPAEPTAVAQTPVPPAPIQQPPPQATPAKPAAPAAAEAVPAASRVGDANSPRLFKATDRDALYDLGKRDGPLNLNSRVAVEGVVESAETSSSGKVFRIEFTGADRQDGFHAVYFPKNDMFKRMQDKFGGENGSGLAGKTIRVSGIVTLFENRRPQIVIQSPDQVEIVN